MKSPHKVFISAVSKEFARARSQVRSDLAAKGYLVRVQDDFTQSGSADTILARLNEYIAECARVVFIVGDYCGGFPPDGAAAPFAGALSPPFTRASYTQWEYFLARKHGCETLFFRRATDYRPDEPANPGDDSAAQTAYANYLFHDCAFFTAPANSGRQTNYPGKC
jgi:hypothetical protein